MTQKIVLAMIAKDTQEKVERAVRSVAPYISSYVIAVAPGDPLATVTLDVPVPGTIVEIPWKNFGHNRTEVLRAAEKLHADAEYLLVLDADDVLEADEGFSLPELTGLGYALQVQESIKYWRAQILKAHVGWKYVGPVHEYATIDHSERVERLEGLKYLRLGASDRGPDKYKRDAEVLAKALEAEPNNCRYAFYYAQSLRDSQDFEQAAVAYIKRVNMGGWHEEVYESAFQAAYCAYLAKIDFPDVVSLFLNAHELGRHRAEPLFWLAKIHLEKQAPAVAFLFAQQATQRPYPERDVLYVQAEVYSWALYDILGHAAYLIGEHAIGKLAAERAFANCPHESEKPRLLQNLKAYEPA